MSTIHGFWGAHAIIAAQQLILLATGHPEQCKVHVSASARSHSLGLAGTAAPLEDSDDVPWSQAYSSDCEAVLLQRYATKGDLGPARVGRIDPETFVETSGRLMELTQELQRQNQATALAVLATTAGDKHELQLLPVYRERAVVLPPPTFRHFTVPNLWLGIGLEEALQSRRTVSLAARDPPPSDVWPCAFLFLAAIVFTGLMLKVFARSVKVDIGEVEPALAAVKGRPCWNWLCPLLSVLVCLSVFIATLFSVANQNSETELHPSKNETVQDTTQLVLRYPIINPGMRAFEASVGVLLSLAMACATLMSWRHVSQVKITFALLAQFMLRGSTISLMIAASFEISYACIADAFGADGEESPSIWSFSMMMVVGFSEELAKLIATTCGTHLCVATVSRPDRSCSSCCSYLCRVLVDGRRAFFLAGVAAGFGFMTVENVSYLVSAASQPPKAFPDLLEPGEAPPSAENMRGGTVNFITAVTIFVRVLLNIHPWLSGVSACRLGRRAFDAAEPTACLGPLELLSAIWPSALIHAAYDFGLICAPGIFAVFLPPVFWYASRSYFVSLWSEDGGAGDATPAVLAPAVNPATEPATSQ